MKILISGASGLIGSRLTPHLRANGHEVTKLVRRTAVASDEAEWNPIAGTVDSAAIEAADAVIHLAGAGVGDKRWNDAYKKTILNSRVDGTRTLAHAIEAATDKPTVFISASAIGFYGDTGDTVVDESSPAGEGFLAEVVVAWEQAAAEARDAGVRVVHPRTGLVMSKHGGALAKLLPIFRAGGGGKLGSGQQWWSHISMRDELSALTWLLDHDVAGPVNLTAPAPARNADAVKELAALVHRPALVPVPAFALRAAIGEFASDVLGSQRVRPQVLTEHGFEFQDPTIADSLRSALEEA